MNRDRIKGCLRQLKGAVLTGWGKLTGNRGQVIRGSRERLLGRVQELYGRAKEESGRHMQYRATRYVPRR